MDETGLTYVISDMGRAAQQDREPVARNRIGSLAHGESDVTNRPGIATGTRVALASSRVTVSRKLTLARTDIEGVHLSP